MSKSEGKNDDEYKSQVNSLPSWKKQTVILTTSNNFESVTN